jgi:hypothetical protein
MVNHQWRHRQACPGDDDPLSGTCSNGFRPDIAALGEDKLLPCSVPDSVIDGAS